MSDLSKKFQQLKKEFYKSIKDDHAKFKSESQDKIKKIQVLASELQGICDKYGFPANIDLKLNKNHNIEIHPFDMRYILHEKYGEITNDDLHQATGESMWMSSSMNC